MITFFLRWRLKHIAKPGGGRRKSLFKRVFTTLIIPENCSVVEEIVSEEDDAIIDDRAQWTR
ncbi:uncharacterized protein PHALS_05665 [Plasmopara halstedii]|uniref:Uncharacterized protein n=1 Tax=Plasmopara halstedii TaxID=4781 RepID=A0A0N7L7W3_PLAHL|nr:uncharacterized protein PHALS_05665 [Plasmopara halstedii]CEG48195.1 hypothetical protein PHALS_05665 [Plasmopara halstedii]|eukprot:XP_024584564.1 hypothetical protein PHALS_05665 [Plasmopara halstedii]